MAEETNITEYIDIEALKKEFFQQGYKKGYDEGYAEGFDAGLEEEKQHDFLRHYDEEFTMEAFRREGYVEKYVETVLKILMDTFEKESGMPYLENHTKKDLEDLKRSLEKEANDKYSIDRAKTLIKKGEHTLPRIAKLSHLPLEKVQELAAKNPV